MVSMKGAVKPRTYRSTVREEAARSTQRAVLEAARAVLAEKGYAAMTMQEVAKRAGVALDTVYASVGRKPVLMRLLLETAISGGDEAVPAAERSYVKDIRAAKTAREKLAIYASALGPIQERLAPVVRALRDAAAQDESLAASWKEIAERRARNMKLLADELLETGELRPELEAREVADVLWATNAPELYMLLVDERGWSTESFAAWLADSWARLFLADVSGAGRPSPAATSSGGPRRMRSPARPR